MEKIKQFVESEKGKDVLIVLIVILVGIGSFELGRLSKENAQTGLKIEYSGADELLGANQAGNALLGLNTTNSENPSTGDKLFFASKKGSKYYPVDCSAGKTIKQENRIYFKTGEEAERAGFSLSGSCQ